MISEPTVATTSPAISASGANHGDHSPAEDGRRPPPELALLSSSPSTGDGP